MSEFVLKKTTGIQKNILLSQEKKIALIVSRFNQTITQSLQNGALRGLQEAGLSTSSIQVIEVPGAFEIPLAGQWAAQTKQFDALIGLGVVIRGDTPHFDYVCEGVTQGVLRVQLDARLPFIFGVLTTDTLQQALVRADETDANKGYEAAKVALEMLVLKESLGIKDYGN